ncbi:4-alpha-glucanotransferase [Erysipelothrix urinaevulpis]|uniref:4-alpha-glucanotransferase n=1 Tax=Erysipelothrix urinaevulpis TaxID=2683717 RepID=UPI00135C5F37|nr:4-alpha-glucanotransferase [Erysipelothrix urinaevulpis]
MRKSGILCPVFSLPGTYGIGDFGKDAYDFVDILHHEKVKIWQILPLNPVGFGYSPYQPFSSYAGDEMYVDLENIAELKDVVLPEKFVNNKVNYLEAKNIKERYLRRAFLLFDANNENYQLFTKDAFWLDDYVKFKVLKMYNGQRSWTEWDESVENYYFPQGEPISEAAYEMDFERYKQFIFMKQWHDLKDYANAKGIEIMGDIPFYVGLDSADVWANQALFELKDKEPIFVAGVPPDYFAKTGQRWGNPIYDWQALKDENYKFWIDRLSWNQDLYDIIRLDHFRAFDTYWKINADCETAIDGVWELGPAYDVLDEIYRQIPNINMIAEDLGDLRPEVHELRKHYQMYGMKITQFALDANENNNDFDDHRTLIIYTGTHDNETIVQWYKDISKENKRHVDNILSEQKLDDRPLNQALIQLSMNSIADVAIIPLADILGLDKKGRINTPGTIGSPNWEWKIEDFDDTIKEMNWFSQSIIASKR